MAYFVDPVRLRGIGRNLFVLICMTKHGVCITLYYRSKSKTAGLARN